MKKLIYRTTAVFAVIAMLLCGVIFVPGNTVSADDDEERITADSGTVGTEYFSIDFSVSGAKRVEQNVNGRYDGQYTPYQKTIYIYADEGDSVTINYTANFPDNDYCKVNLGLAYSVSEYGFKSFVSTDDGTEEFGGISAVGTGSITRTIGADTSGMGEIYAGFRYWPRKDGAFGDEYDQYSGMSEEDARSILSKSVGVYLNTVVVVEGKKEETGNSGRIALRTISISNPGFWGAIEGVSCESFDEVIGTSYFSYDDKGNYKLEIPQWNPVGQEEIYMEAMTLTGQFEDYDGNLFPPELSTYGPAGSGQADPTDTRCYSSDEVMDVPLTVDHVYVQTQRTYYNELRIILGYYFVDDYGYGFTSIIFEPIDYNEDTSPTTVIVDTSAADSEGEDGGVIIDDEIVESKKSDAESDKGRSGSKAGAVGGGLLVGAAAAAATAARGGKKKKKSGSTYRMYVYKDFGNYIRKGAPAVYVFARIVETDSKGIQKNCPQLTSQIRAYSSTQGLLVTDRGMSDIWKAAEVCVPDENLSGTEGIVSFTFTGAGGQFTQNVHFRLIHQSPYITYPEKPLADAAMCVDLLIGDSEPSEVLFQLNDFTSPPKNINITSSNALISLSCEPVNAGTGLYKAVIHNSTAPAREPIGEYPINVSAHIRADNENEFAEGSITLYLYPEGISVNVYKAKTEEDRLVVPANEGESIDARKPVLKRTGFTVMAAYKDPTGKVIVSFDVKVSDKLVAENSFSHNALSKIKYEIAHYEGGNWFIEPKTPLIEEKDKLYDYILAMEFSGGNGYSYNLPVRLRGESIDPGFMARQAELEKLKRITQIVGITQNGAAYRRIREGRTKTAEDIFLLRRLICEEAIEYYSNDAKELVAVADHMTKWINGLDLAKYAGDLCFSILIRIYFKEKGDYAEAVLTPLKDIFTQIVGEIWAAREFGEPLPSYDQMYFTIQFEKIIENEIIAFLTGEEIGTKVNPKYKANLVMFLVSLGAGLNFFRHYREEESSGSETPFWNAFWGMVNDLSINALKALLLQKFSSMYKDNPTVKEFIRKYLLYDIGDAALRSNSSFGAVAKRLCEGVCYVTGDLVGKGIEGTTGAFKSMTEGLKIKIIYEGEVYDIPVFNVLSSLVEKFGLMLSFDRFKEYFVENIKNKAPAQPQFRPVPEVEEENRRI